MQVNQQYPNVLELFL